MAVPRFIASVRIIALLTMVSRVLGLMRDMVCAAVFGTSGTWAAFTVAFRIPNLFRKLFGEGALSAAFVPIFSQRFHVEGPGSAQAAARRIMGLQVAVLTLLTLVGEVVVLVLWLAWPTDERGRLALILTAILLPHVVSVCATALLGGMLNVLRNFWIPTLAPIILNVFEVAGVLAAWWMRKGHEIPAVWPVIVGVMLAGAVQVAIPWYALHRRGIRLIPKVSWDDPAVVRVIRLLGPTLLGLAAVQINTLMDTLIAWWFIPREGAPVVLDYAQRLYQLPLGVIGISVATAIFEQMSAEAALKQIGDLRRTAMEGLKLMLFVGLPISVGMGLLAWPITALIFQRGKFTAEDTDLVAYTSIFYMAGIWGYMSQHVFARGFYAMQRPQTPARIATWVVGLNLSMNLMLVRFMHEAGLALATAVCAYIQLLLLSRAWRDLTGSYAVKGLVLCAVRTAVATAGMAAAILLARWLLGPAAGNAAHLGVSMAVGGAVFWGLAYVLGSTEARLLAAGLGRRRARELAAAE